MTGHLPKRSGGTTPNRRRARAAGTRRRRHPRQQRRRHADGALRLRPARGAPAHGRDLLGAMTATEVFLDQLRANGCGDLVNVSSVAGRVAPAGFAAYAATKWGINGWSEALRVELQPDIRVTVIEPGAITTELTDHITDPASKQANKTATAEMGIPPQDIADVIAFADGRPQRVTLNEILVRPTAQAM